MAEDEEDGVCDVDAAAVDVEEDEAADEEEEEDMGKMNRRARKAKALRRIQIMRHLAA